MKKTDKPIADQHHQTFESIRQFDPDGGEYWLARDLQPLLDYAAWDKFKPVLDKAVEACRQSGHEADHHFSRVAKLVQIGSGARRQTTDHIEDVLGMVEISSGASQPYEEIVRLKLAAPNAERREPVTICHGFKGGAKLPPPLRQTLESFPRNLHSVRLEPRRRGHG
ncbi:MAG: hypothetical protein EA400_13385 [Chromatiaceae bacterium]|nr:MAG: hypothetical protein EA400_13385 [Chromatiaceae bacterium]